MSSSDIEAERLRAEFERRDREIGSEFYALTRPANLFIRHGQERALLTALQRINALPLGDKRLLEVGCGRGQWFSVLEDFGARRERLSGIELDAVRLAIARQRFAGADLQVGDASQMPWPARSFDLVFQSTVFTSILDLEMRRSVAREMVRVLAVGGAILWYDFRYNNPMNKHVRGIGSEELAQLFPGCSIELASATLAPPVARRIVPRSWLVASALEKLRVFNTHYLAVIRPHP